MNKEKLIKTAFILAVVTVGYNIAEGLVSVFFKGKLSKRPAVKN